MRPTSLWGVQHNTGQLMQPAGGTRNQTVNREEWVHAGAGGVKGLNEDGWETANSKISK